MTDEKEPEVVTETQIIEPKEQMTKAMGGQFFQAAAAALNSGKAEDIVNLLPISQEAKDEMLRSSKREDERWADLGRKLDRMADVIQVCANTIDLQTHAIQRLENIVRQVQREQDLQKRAWGRMTDYFRNYYDEEKAKVEVREAAELERSKQVTTPKGQPKVA